MAVLVSICMLFCQFGAAGAASTQSEAGNTEISYTMEGTTVIEHVVLASADEVINIERAVFPDGKMVVKNDGIVVSTLYDADYNVFLGLYEHQGTYANIPMPMIYPNDGCPLEKSQYIHQYIGSPGDRVVTINHKALEGAKDIATISTILLGLLQSPAAAVTGIAGWILDKMIDGQANFDKVTVSTDTYQVLFAVDNSYYIHCYHETLQFYKANSSTPFSTQTDFYQVIGG